MLRHILTFALAALLCVQAAAQTGFPGFGAVAAVPDTTASGAPRTRLACIGDSITFGYGLKSPFTDSYPAVLQGLMGEEWLVRNFGISARTMSQSGDRPYMREQIYQMAKDFAPDVVTIMLGTNDVKPENWSPADFESSYELMVSELKALPSEPVIYLCLPATVHGERWGIKDSTIVAGAIPVIERVAAREGLDIIDTHAATADYAEHFPDFIHPDVEASAALAAALYSALCPAEEN